MTKHVCMPRYNIPIDIHPAGHGDIICHHNQMRFTYQLTLSNPAKKKNKKVKTAINLNPVPIYYVMLSYITN